MECWLLCVSLASCLSLISLNLSFLTIERRSLLPQLYGSKETRALLLNSEGPYKYSLVFSRESVSYFCWYPKRHPKKLGAAPEWPLDSPGTLAGTWEGLTQSTPFVLFLASQCCSWAWTGKLPEVRSLPYIAVPLKGDKKALLSEERV